MMSRWMMAFVAVLALGAPRLPLADGVSYEDRHPQEAQKKGSTGSSGTAEGAGSGGMEGMQGMPGMQHQRGDTQGKHKRTMMCSCPCSSAPSKPDKS